jgi:AraC family transcriptional regulator of adaptative response/methylated-DNA-[protein]-cysteine methyltransferase
VVQKGGALAGYRWGLPRKAALLDAEAHRTGVDAGAANSAPLVKADAAAVAEAAGAGKRKAKLSITPTPNLDHAA